MQGCPVLCHGDEIRNVVFMFIGLGDGREAGSSDSGQVASGWIELVAVVRQPGG
jgi:hypothetical protein